MALIKCRFCQKQVSDKARVCPHCHSRLIEDEKPKVIKDEEVAVVPTPEEIERQDTSSNEIAEAINQDNEQPINHKSSKSWLWVTLSAILLILIGGGIGGYFYYENVYLPEKIDREASRTYPIVNVQLRSSKMADGDFNKVATLPFGAELITYEQDSLWAKVKYVSPNPNEKPLEGYVASPYLISKADFYLVNSIFGDNDAREVLATAKVRKALLDFYKSKGIIGKMSPEMAAEVGLPYNPQNQWQAIFHHGQTKPNEVLFKRVWNPSSKFTDMGLFLENVVTGQVLFIYVTFDDDETPHIRTVSEVSSYHKGHGIQDMKWHSSSLCVTYSDGSVHSM
ncbi:MAG: hypothetical protein NC548_47325 [Lachnospiraceae bacterium]|nr:hypothetical protein [Lachnospiraceae bacterium]